MAEASNAATSEMVERGLHAIKRLPVYRRSRNVTPPPSLRDLLRLLESYIASPSHYAPPLKSVLFDAVQSLTPRRQKCASVKKIQQTAQEWMEPGSNVEAICKRLGLNLDAKGNYLYSFGEDYKRMQTAKRTIKRKKLKQSKDLKDQEMKKLKEIMKQLKRQLVTVVQERDLELKKV